MCQSVLEEPDFFPQVLDDLLLMLVHPASNGDDEKEKWVETLREIFSSKMVDGGGIVEVRSLPRAKQDAVG